MLGGGGGEVDPRFIEPGLLLAIIMIIRNAHATTVAPSARCFTGMRSTRSTPWRNVVLMDGIPSYFFTDLR
jgi:hypothetical protein